MKETKAIYVAIGIIILAAVGFGIAKSKYSTPATTIKVSGNFKENTTFNTAIDIAEDQGYFEKYNIKVEKVDTVAGTQLLGTHKIDAAILAASSPVNLFLNNKDVKILATLNNYPATFHIVSRLSEDKLTQTKKIGVNQIGNADHLSAVLVAEKMGIKNPEFVLAPDDKSKTALLAKGEIDFAFIISQTALENIKKINKYTIIKPEDAFKGFSLPVSLNTTETAINEKPEAMEGFVKAINSSIKYDKNNKNKMIIYMQEKYGLSKEGAEYIYERDEYSRQDLNFVPSEETYKNVVELISKFMKVANPTRNISELLSAEFAKNATK